MPRPAGVDAANTKASKARISLRADIDKLMDYFLLTESVRYQEFARVWQALNFALIYVGLKDNKDKKEFILDAFELVSEFLQPPYDLQRRVCALYTLYGLYYTQTHNPKIKIRMSLDDWKETLSLHEDLQEQGHLDALFVFHKMRLDKAFMFTATHTPMFYQGRTKKPEDFEKWAAKHQGFMASVLDEDLLQELEQVHKSYQADKETMNLQEDASMSMVKDSMSDYVMERISNIDVPREAQEPEALADSRSRASRIREIKKRSFASPTQASRARRSGISGTDDGSETDGDLTYHPTASGKNRKGKKMKKRGGKKKSDLDDSVSSPVRNKRQRTPDVGDSDMSLSSPKTKRKDTSSDVSPNLEGEGSAKKKKRRTKKSLDKSKSETLEPVKETDEVEDHSEAKNSTKSKKTPKKSNEGKKHKQKSSPKEVAESGKKKKKKPSENKAASKGTPKTSKEEHAVPKKTKNKKTPHDRPQRLVSLKSPSADAKESSPESHETIKIKIETPTKEKETVNESPRKRPRKSNTPRRLTRSQDTSN